MSPWDRVRQLPPGYAEGYEPSQICHRYAREPFHWDEVEAIAKHPLYQAVVKLAKARIMQALVDLGGKNESLRNAAFMWVYSDQSDFRAWCSDAGFAPGIVREKARQIVTDGMSWRLPAGQGPRYGKRSRKGKA